MTEQEFIDLVKTVNEHFDPADMFEKHEAAYKQLKAAGMLPPEPTPKKSFWQWLFG